MTPELFKDEELFGEDGLLPSEKTPIALAQRKYNMYIQNQFEKALKGFEEEKKASEIFCYQRCLDNEDKFVECYKKQLCSSVLQVIRGPGAEPPGKF